MDSELGDTIRELLASNTARAFVEDVTNYARRLEDETGTAPSIRYQLGYRHLIVEHMDYSKLGRTVFLRCRDEDGREEHVAGVVGSMVLSIVPGKRGQER